MRQLATRVLIICLVLVGIMAVRSFSRAEAESAVRKQAHSLELARMRLASLSSAELIEKTMPTAEVFSTKFELLARSLAAVDVPDGIYCEFGVFSGETINYMADLKPGVTFHGFDSFEGLPEDWRTGFGKGTFAMDGLPEVRSNVKLYKGWFDATLPQFAKDNPGPVAFLHMDADLYSSTKTVFDALGDRLQPGSVIHFDEYFNYPGWQRGEFQAFEELVEKLGIEYEVLGYCDGPREFEQASFKIVSIGLQTAPAEAMPEVSDLRVP